MTPNLSQFDKNGNLNICLTCAGCEHREKYLDNGCRLIQCDNYKEHGNDKNDSM